MDDAERSGLKASTRFVIDKHSIPLMMPSTLGDDLKSAAVHNSMQVFVISSRMDPSRLNRF